MRALTIPQAEQIVRKRVISTRDVTSQVVRAAWDRLSTQLPADAVAQLAQEGLTYRVNNLFHGARALTVTQPQTVSVDTRYEDSPACTDMWVEVYYATAGGEVKPLIDFTVEDCLFVATDARAKAAGWYAVAGFFDHVAGRLREHKVEAVSDLPGDVRFELAEKWPKHSMERAEGE